MNKPGAFLSVVFIIVVMGCGQREQAAVESDGVLKPAKSPGMELEGMFRYMADAAIFRDCRNNKTYPVSMEGEYIELERAYLNSGIEPGAEVMVKLEGRLLERPSMEGNHNIIKLIVDKSHYVLPEKTCAPTVHAELAGTYWKLIELTGQEVITLEGMKEAHMILATEDTRVHGNAGCNNFFGQFQEEQSGLTFSALGSTMMACPPQAMDTERGFLTALGTTTRYEISGLFLELYAEDQLLARLEAIYL
jgi:copper homeostasis protein (lipoprotein)